MLLESSPELTRRGLELSSELLDLKKNPLEVFWVC